MNSGRRTRDFKHKDVETNSVINDEWLMIRDFSIVPLGFIVYCLFFSPMFGKSMMNDVWLISSVGHTIQLMIWIMIINGDSLKQQVNGSHIWDDTQRGREREVP